MPEQPEPNFFWASSLVEPKRSYKYIVNWTESGLGWFLVSAIDLPKYELGEVTTSALNHTFKYPGKITWQDTNIEITDSESVNAVKILMNKLTESGYTAPETPDVYRTISKEGCIRALGILLVKEITWDEKLIGEWTFKNAWIKSFDSGKRSYETDETVKINLAVTYDWAVYKGSSKPYPPINVG